MSNFEDSFRVGIHAARSALNSQREIESVIQDFSESLQVATGGRVKVVQREVAVGLGAILSQKLESERRTKTLAVVPADGAPGKGLPSVEVAKWRYNEAGYPCWLIVGGQEIACVDRLALVEALGTLASSPRMGDAILRVIDGAR